MPSPPLAVLDRRARPLRHLEVSLEDRCDRDGPASSLAESAPLTRAEIVRLVRMTVELGVQALSLSSGGAPHRRDLPELLAELASIPGLEVSLVANAFPCPEAEALGSALTGGQGEPESSPESACERCSRVRLSPDGLLSTCVFAHCGWDLRTLLRQGWEDELIGALVRHVWQGRRDRY